MFVSTLPCSGSSIKMNVIVTSFTILSLDCFFPHLSKFIALATTAVVGSSQQRVKLWYLICSLPKLRVIAEKQNLQQKNNNQIQCEQIVRC